ncbi:hypothetical protein MLD38_031926 [Melastoma candidum]|uniref:Uncharacterized protein n=1 Tax=Melastoma candidum TaxID=119954 RepID=A0ACB9MQS7_9MYRT|nr:hypothetical protein MLD38_031926 [Melastoma candidum]
MILATTIKEFLIKFPSTSSSPRRFLHSVPVACGALSSAVSSQEDRALDPLELFEYYRRFKQLSVADTQCFHSQLIKYGSLHSSVFVANSLVDSYCKCADMWDAMKVFEEMPERDVVSWNIVVSGCNRGSLFAESWELFCRMHCSGYQADGMTYGTALFACVVRGDLACGMQVYALANKSGFLGDYYVRAG